VTENGSGSRGRVYVFVSCWSENVYCCGCFVELQRIIYCLFLYVIVPMLGPMPPFTLRIWNVPVDLKRAHILDDALLVFATFARLYPYEHMN
jgi:hypothetical protein